MAIARSTPSHYLKRILVALLTVSQVSCYSLLSLPENRPEIKSRKKAGRITLSILSLGIAAGGFNRREAIVERRREQNRSTLQFLLAMQEASTLDSLSRLMGGTPNCVRDGRIRSCSWEVDSREFQWRFSGSGNAFGVSGAFYRVQTAGDLLKVICSLPVEGGKRQAGSCAHNLSGQIAGETDPPPCRGHPIFCPPDYEDLSRQVPAGATNGK